MAEVHALRSGDQDAFRALVGRLHPGLVRVARLYVPPPLADEVVQETWAAMICSLDSFEGRSTINTWMHRILLNKVRALAKRESLVVPFAAMGHTSHEQGADRRPVEPDRFRSDGPLVGHWTETPLRWETLPEGRVEGAETLRLVSEGLTALPKAVREIVELRDVQGWSSSEVCDLLDITAVNQRVLLHRGRVAIRAMLEEHLSDDC